MARLVSRSPTAFEVSGMKETARSWVYLTLVLPSRSRDSLALSFSRFSLLIFFSRSVNTRLLLLFLLRKGPHSRNELQSLVLSLRVSQSCLSKSRNDYRYGRRWPNIRVNPSVKLDTRREKTGAREQNISSSSTRSRGAPALSLFLFPIDVRYINNNCEKFLDR